MKARSRNQAEIQAEIKPKSSQILKAETRAEPKPSRSQPKPATPEVDGVDPALLPALGAPTPYRAPEGTEGPVKP